MELYSQSNRVKFYHFYSSPLAQRIRLALHYKQITYDDIPIDYDEDHIFFELGIEYSPLILQLSEHNIHLDSKGILAKIDSLFPSGKKLFTLDMPAWEALLAWRKKVDYLLERLYAPIKISYKDIALSQNNIYAYKTEIKRRFGQSVEELANDRYGSFEQFSQISNLDALSKHLAQSKYYIAEFSVADIILAADLAPLQLLDGVSLPIDMMYYIKRVYELCNLSPTEGLTAYNL